MYLIKLILTMFILIFTTAGIVLSLTYINRSSKKMLVTTLGFSSQIYLGFLGIIVHEFSHFIVAIFFGHKIKQVKFIILPKQAHTDGNLGYVDHTWNNHSLWQSLGNLFIGTAPIWGCTTFLYATIQYMLPNLYVYFSNVQEAILSKQWSNIFNFPATCGSTLHDYIITIIAIYLICNVTIGGFDLSNADLMSSWPAFLALCTVILIICIASYFIGLSTLVDILLLKMSLNFVIVMSLSLIFSILINILIRYFCFFIKLQK